MPLVNCQNCDQQFSKWPADIKRGYGKFCSMECKYQASRKHGLTVKDADNVGQFSYSGAIERCHNPSNPGYPNYGGRGIVVCDRWRYGADGKAGIECFFEDMGPRPDKNYSIDRIDPNGNYDPGNCRWATTVEQARNKRTSKAVIRSDGVEFPTCIEAAASVGLRPNTISSVCRGRERSAGGYGWRYAG